MPSLPAAIHGDNTTFVRGHTLACVRKSCICDAITWSLARGLVRHDEVNWCTVLTRYM